mgnify:FL=1
MAIVIPACKGRFLKETLDSIAVQAHKDEFVLYIGDDASPERLDKIVESYQNKVNLVYHRFSENMGGQRFGGPLGEVYPAVCRAVYLAFLG